MRYFLCLVLPLLVVGPFLWGQSLKVRSAEPRKTPTAQVFSKDAPSIPLTVPAGTPLKVVLDQEVRIQKAGQPIHGKTAEPIYAFDKLLVPPGSDVTGKMGGRCRQWGIRIQAGRDYRWGPSRTRGSSHFLARGRDVVYPKDMSMILDLGTRKKQGANLEGTARDDSRFSGTFLRSRSATNTKQPSFE